MAPAARSPGALSNRLSELRFYLDENVPTEVGRQLRSSGVDAVTARPGASRYGAGGFLTGGRSGIEGPGESKSALSTPARRTPAWRRRRLTSGPFW
jgi:hypothetical protein